MAALTLYLALFSLAVTVAATTVAAVSFAVFRHRSALWLTQVLGGLAWFALTVVVAALEAQGATNTGPPGLRLLWQSLGAVFLVHALPRFALAAFGAPVNRLWGIFLSGATLATAVLSALRTASGWADTSTVFALPGLLLEFVLYAVVGTTLGLTLVFQSRLPNRGLYRTVVAQTVVIAVLVLLVVTSVFAAGHTVTSLLRPKYMVGHAPSPYFVERFRLSPRELDVVNAVLGGQSNKDMADQLFNLLRSEGE